ncbi:hypothetical protein E1B28_003163 [Marasmius oreades]|nr:uncharacterized protein E1B28_003163 [Marasmius oreades]KAG7085613.1 hypothetical protein E1B28_003163 [Marasmius oreades]
MKLSRILHPIHISPQSAPASINDVATEILTIIFGLCVEGGSWEMRRKEAPMLLTRVCSRWRRIVINTPSLWAKLSFFITKPPPSNLVQRISDVWLSRLGTTGPLELSLNVIRTIASTQDRLRISHFLNDFLCLYHPLIPRLQSLALSDVFLPHSDGQILFTSLPMLQPLNLRHLTLQSGRPPGPMLEWTHSLLPSLQNLNTVIWNENRVQSFLRTAPLIHLTSLEFESTFLGFPLWRDDLQKLFQEAPQLTTLSLTFANNPPPAITPGTSAIVHNRLQVLRVGISLNENGTSVVPNTFDHITLPALLEFQINASPLLSDWEATSIVNFLKRSRCNLAKLTLDPPPRIEDITECLEIESIETHLSELHISNANWAEQEHWFTEDSDDPKVPVMLPLLQYLSTSRRVGDITRLPLPSLVDMSVWIDPFADMDGLVEVVEQRLQVVDEISGAVLPPENGVSCLKQLTIVAVIEQEDYRSWVMETEFRDKYIQWQGFDEELQMFVDDFVSRKVPNGWKLGMKETVGLPSDVSVPDEDADVENEELDQEYDNDEEDFVYTDHEMDSDE